jgi:hypothetical protein
MRRGGAGLSWNHVAALASIAIVPFSAARGLDAPASTAVVLISIDGLRRDAVTPKAMPFLSEVSARGVAATSARCLDPPYTLANHTSMLTGLTPEIHGIVDPLSAGGRDPGQTVLDLAHLSGLKVAVYLSKAKLDYLVRPESCERLYIVETEVSHALVSDLVSDLDTRGEAWDLTFLHIADPDAAGHRAGWMSADYLDAVARSDAYVKELWTSLDRLGELGRTAWIFTSDHGGLGFRHLGDFPEVRDIPWVAVGPRIRQGGLVDMPMSVHDTAPTLLSLLGVEVPQGIEGRVVTGIFDVEQRGFVQGDVDGDGTFRLADVVAVLVYLFAGRGAVCPVAGDLDGDSALDVSDAVRGLLMFFDLERLPELCRRAPAGDLNQCATNCSL